LLHLHISSLGAQLDFMWNSVGKQCTYWERRSVKWITMNDDDPEAINLGLMDLTNYCFQKDVNVTYGGVIVDWFNYMKTLLYCRVMYYRLRQIIAVSS
jgi:hypothetical protein